MPAGGATEAAGIDGIFDTNSSPRCLPVVSGGNFCVVAATMLTISQPLRATGSRPLVLIGRDIIMATAAIDVGSHRGANPEVGAGADASECGVGTNPGPNGGGAGGSFNGLGGSGGGTGGTASSSLVPVAALRGGCAGQDGMSGDKGVRGHSGGAVFLIAGTKIVATGGINAGGEGGGGAGLGAQGGGGGGGSGGMIGFDAPVVTLGGVIIANGGGGGEGSSPGAVGTSGSDAVTVGPAAGGTSGVGGAGGAGSAGSRAGPGFAGVNGNAGDGGGGGGVGIIVAPHGTAAESSMTSPPLTDL